MKMRIIRFTYAAPDSFPGECSFIVPTPSVGTQNFRTLLKSIIESELPDKNEIIAVESTGPDFNFSHSINEGIKMSKFRYKLLLNDDCVLTPRAIHNALDHEKRDNCLIGGLLYYPSGEIQHCGGIVRFFLPITIVSFMLKGAPFFSIRDYVKAKKCSNYYLRTFHLRKQTSRNINYLTGAFLLISSDIITKIGLFDENFKNGFEDLDFSIRAKKAGFGLCIPNDVIAYHTEHPSLKKLDSNYYDNLSYFTNKWRKDELIKILRS